MAEDRILYTLPYGSKHLLRLYLVLIFGIQTPSEAKVNIHKDGETHGETLGKSSTFMLVSRHLCYFTLEYVYIYIYIQI